MADGDPEGKSPRRNFLSKFRFLRGKQTTETNNQQKQSNETQKQNQKQRRRAISPEDGVWPTQDDGINSQSTNDENAGKTNKTYDKNIQTKYAPWGDIQHPTLGSFGRKSSLKNSQTNKRRKKKFCSKSG